ncbi:MAG: helix-turn-helix domain containing protein [Ignavibacteriaceae bacterium]|nr:helix-turn-helix domain containing protein [Ignavibacteriaceae bacterium]
MEDIEIKQRILKKAGEMFQQFGFSRVTMEEIAVELGMSKKTLYKFFSGKEQLLKEMVIAMKCKLEDYVMELWGNNEISFLEKLKNLMNYIGNQSSALKGPLAHDLQKNFPDLWEEIRESRRTHSLQKFSLLIDEGIQKGVFRKDIDQQIVVLLYIHAIQGILNPEVLTQLPYTYNQVFDSIIRVFLEGIFTEEGRNQYLSIKHEDNLQSTSANIKN